MAGALMLGVACCVLIICLSASLLASFLGGLAQKKYDQKPPVKDFTGPETMPVGGGGAPGGAAGGAAGGAGSKPAGTKPVPILDQGRTKAIVTAALTKTAAQVVADIKALGTVRVSTAFFVAAMAPLNREQRRRVVSTMTQMTSMADTPGVQAFVAQALQYALASPDVKGQQEIEMKETDLQCPSGWERCDSPKFSGYEPNMDFHLSKLMTDDKVRVTKASRGFCCKFGNAANDPRPEVIDKVKKARNTFNKVFFIVDLVLGIVSLVLPFTKIGQLPEMVVDVISDAFSVASMRVSEVMGRQLDVAFDDAKPLISCQYPPGGDEFWKEHPNGIYMATFNDKDGKPAQAFYSRDKCPIRVLPIAVALYGEQIKNATGTVNGTFEGEFDIMKFEDFDPRNPQKIHCWLDSSKTKQQLPQCQNPRFGMCANPYVKTCNQRPYTEMEKCRQRFGTNPRAWGGGRDPCAPTQAPAFSDCVRKCPRVGFRGSGGADPACLKKCSSST